MADATFFVGLDLGQVHDPTALCISQRSLLPADPAGVRRRREYQHAVRHLQRFDLGTPYPNIVRRVAGVLDLRLSQLDWRAAKLYPKQADTRPLRDAMLVIDGTGVGRPVVDLFREADLPCRIIPVLITAGSAPVSVDINGYYHVPKRDLAGALQATVQTRRLGVAESLPEAEMLTEEMKNFKIKVTTSANEVFEAWREKDTDDLVLAAAMCVWAGEREAFEDCDAIPEAAGTNIHVRQRLWPGTWSPADW